ncbi:acyltransferase family protein [Janibacter anophelis]|uniref:acyltransferase family protein n=1 Tax=Janibacter anophelis TaxID=319054 RepID=UPI003F7FDE49
MTRSVEGLREQASGVESAGSSGRHHRRDIQGLRAFAVVVVVLNHAFPELFPGGYVGVDVFFVISGFVITGLIRRGVASGSFSFARFYVRRIYRLFPALAVCVACTAALSAVFVSPVGIQAQSAVTGLAAVFWMSNFSLWFFSSDYFSPHVQMNPFLHTWSLGVEEQFYIVFPAILVFAGGVLARKGRSRTSAALVVGAISIASLALAVVFTYGLSQPLRGADAFSFYSVFTRFWEFGVGGLLALSLEGARRRAARWVTALGVAGMVLLVCTLFLYSEVTPFPGYLALVPVVGAGLVIASGPSGPVARALSLAPVVHLGNISYSWYLWHWPALVIGKRVLGDSGLAVLLLLVLSYAAALASFAYVEQKWRHRSSDGHIRRLLPVVPLLVVPALVVCVLGVGGQKAWWNSSVRTSTAELTPRPAKSGACGGFQGPMSTRDISQCTWGADRPGRPIYLMGDSNAGQFTEALIGASERLGRPLVVATRGGCPMVDVETRVKGSAGLPAQGCRAWFNDAKTWLADQEPGTVVIAGAGEAITDRSLEVRGQQGLWSSDEATKSDLWRQGSRAASKAVDAAGHDVVVVAPIPHLEGSGRPWWHPAECSNAHWFQGDPKACNREVPRSTYLAAQAQDRTAAREAAEVVDGTYLDLQDMLCDNGMCSAFRDGHWWYRDGLHISTYGSERLVEPFEGALDQAAENDR